MNDPRIYECDICNSYHRWLWSGDCREDSERFMPEEYASKIGVFEFDLDIRSMDDRLAADGEGEA